MKKLVSLLLCLAMLLSLSAFAGAEAVEKVEEPTIHAEQSAEPQWDENHETILLEMGADYGQGAKSFALVVSHLNEVTICTVHTDEKTVGAALAALNIVAGEDSEFGLYVKTIDGYTADYDTDGSCWAFYIDGEYATTGVDSTDIDEEATYLLQVEGLELEEGTTIPLMDGQNYGIGDKTFVFQVIDGEGVEIAVTVCTDQDTVGAALEEWSIIAGEDSDFGLYVKTINNITADYDTDGSYWAFYIDGEYAQTGVDSTEINEDAVYTFQVEKA